MKYMFYPWGIDENNKFLFYVLNQQKNKKKNKNVVRRELLSKFIWIREGFEFRERKNVYAILRGERWVKRRTKNFY